MDLMDCIVGLGALSLPEFAAAMHLVVARRFAISFKFHAILLLFKMFYLFYLYLNSTFKYARNRLYICRNNIPLPPILPECLIPNNKFFESCQPAEADLLHLDDDKDTTDNSLPNTNSVITDVHTAPFKTLDKKQPANIIGSHTGNSRPTTIQTKNPHQNNSNKGSTSSSSPINELEISPTKSNKISSSKEWINQSSKEWTKFTESPTSNVSSPGPKPANFDMQRTAQAVGSDPQILHPVPLRITPVTTENNEDESNRLSYHRKSENYMYEGGIITIRDADTSSPKQYAVQRDSGQNDLRAIQRPQPKKIIQNKNSIGAGISIPPPPQRESQILNNSDAREWHANACDAIDNVAPALLKKQDQPPPPPPRLTL